MRVIATCLDCDWFPEVARFVINERFLWIRYTGF